MGVYIKGMEMPESCFMCELMQRTDGGMYMKCPLVKFKCSSEDFYGYFAEHRQAQCPLIEVPEPHGRLIDADALQKLFEARWHYLQVLNWDENPTAEAKQTGVNWCINTLHDEAPTIIPASGGSET